VALADFFLAAVVVSVTSCLFGLFFWGLVPAGVITEEVLLAELCRVLAFNPAQQNGTT